MAALAMLAIGSLVAVAPAAGDDGPATAPALTPDGVIVQWLPDADHGEKVAARADAEVTFEGDLGSREFQLVEVEAGQSPEDAVRALEADPAVAVAERDGYRTLDAVPNDPLFDQQWGAQNLGTGIDGFAGAVAGDDISLTAAWDRTVGSPSVVMADIDSGYRFGDGDLGPVAWTNPGEIPGNSIDDDGNGFVDDVHGYDFVGASATSPTSDNDPTDDNLISGGHGLHTAGIMGAAGNNGVGISGVARNATIMPLRVCANQPSSNETRCPNSSIIAAINYAGDNGAKVANMSLGGNTFNQTEVNAIAAHPGTLYVISAGNDGGNNDGGEAAPKGHHYPCDYRPTVDASPPVVGAIDNIVCVAATNQADGLASFSDWGATSVDLGAPGTEILSTFLAKENWLSDSFETNNFATKWADFGAPGYGRAGVGDGPLTSFGMTDTPGAAPEANHTYGVESKAAASIPAGTGVCRVRGMRFLKGSAVYGLIRDGSFSPELEFTPGQTAGSSMVTFQTMPILNLGGHSVKMFFEYRAGSSPTAAEGFWLDDVHLECFAPLSAPLAYEFLQGTSMAAPQVTGAAALLWSLKPSASVTEVREALLDSADPVASLSGKTVTGGRLDVAAALDELVPPGTETVAPDTAITSQPASSTQSTTAKFEFTRTDADAGTFECKLDGGAFAPCSSPDSIVVAAGAHTFQVRAKSSAGIVDPTPAAAPWTVTTPPTEPENQPPPEQKIEPTPNQVASCKVPKLAGLTLAKAKSALKTAGCTLGKVTKPKPKKGKKLGALVVRSSSPAAGASSSGPVALKLGPKPSVHRH